MSRVPFQMCARSRSHVAHSSVSGLAFANGAVPSEPRARVGACPLPRAGLRLGRHGWSSLPCPPGPWLLLRLPTGRRRPMLSAAELGATPARRHATSPADWRTETLWRTEERRRWAVSRASPPPPFGGVSQLAQTPRAPGWPMMAVTPRALRLGSPVAGVLHWKSPLNRKLVRLLRRWRRSCARERSLRSHYFLPHSYSLRE